MLKKLIWIGLILGIYLTGCNDNDSENASSSEELSTTIAQLLSTSLHHTTAGMNYFYAKEQGGFEQFTHVSYNDLACQECHVESTECTICHETPGDTPENSKCFTCHTRQQAEQMLSPDYHLLSTDSGGLGMKCADCHSAQQVHGDGQRYQSMHDKPSQVDCQQSDCHNNLNMNKSMHRKHHDQLDCAACHVKTTPVCYNCHFTEATYFSAQIFLQPPRDDWKFLVKSTVTDQITTGVFQPLTDYQGHTFYVIAPYFAHTIQKESAVSCQSCHNSEALREYLDKGTMTLATWNEQDKQLEPHVQGVVPIPLDWQTALRTDFLVQDATGEWIYQGNTPDATQMLFAEPIDIGNVPQF